MTDLTVAIDEAISDERLREREPCPCIASVARTTHDADWWHCTCASCLRTWLCRRRAGEGAA